MKTVKPLTSLLKGGQQERRFIGPVAAKGIGSMTLGDGLAGRQIRAREPKRLRGERDGSERQAHACRELNDTPYASAL